MEMLEMNKNAIAILEQWDPFNDGRNAYKIEIVEDVAELYRIDHPADLAKQNI